MGKIAKYLNQLTVGNVFDNPEVLEKYSTDYSALEIKPKFVAFPESTDDVRKLVRFFSELAEKDIRVAVTARGGGHDKNGADLTNGVVVSTKKLNKLLEIDPRERLVHVQAGITLKELNTALSVSGITIPISGHEDETIGGLISNCPVDDQMHKYGGISDYVERIEVVLSNGDLLQTERLKKYAAAKVASEKTREGEIYHKIAKLCYDKKSLIESIGEKERDLAGYPFISKVVKRESMDLMPIFFGAEGTLGIITEVILRAVPLKNKTVRAIMTCKDLDTAISYMDMVAELKPERLDIYDLKIIQEARETGKNLDGVIRKLDDGWTVFTCFAEWGNRNLRKIEAMKNHLPRGTKIIIEDKNNRQILDEFENSLVNYLSYVRDSERVPLLTDFSLPSYNLAKFDEDLQVLAEKTGLDLALYGSYASGNYNLRPKFNLEDTDFRKKATTFLRAGAYIIERQGGKLTGGTPEGRVKAVVTNESMSDTEKEMYQEIKKIFDPQGILNPEVKLGATSQFTLTHFRKNNQIKL